MIELSLKKFLDGHLSVPSFFEVPAKAPKKYVVIEKTGSSKVNYISSATVAFQSYADSLFEAALLNDEVKAVVEKLIELNEITSVRLNSDYNFTDPTTKQYRYQAVYDIGHY